MYLIVTYPAEISLAIPNASLQAKGYYIKESVVLQVHVTEEAQVQELLSLVSCLL